MIAIEKLSFWEKVTYFEQIDHLVIGSGIVGLSTALNLRGKFPSAKIMVLERGYLPTGASTKNAGFACFGSPSEMLSDLEFMDENRVMSLVELRWRGLQLLKQNIGGHNMDYKPCGSYDIFRKEDDLAWQKSKDALPYLNEILGKVIGKSDIYQESAKPKEQGIKGLLGSIFNAYEGSLDTGKMMDSFLRLVAEKKITVLNGFEVMNFETLGAHVEIETQFGRIKAQHLWICTNGFTQALLPKIQLNPARAQVLVTSPIQDLKLDSTYHYDAGYYYFRVVNGNRVLIGGARNVDFEGETTTHLETTSNIEAAILRLLTEVILPEKKFSIDYKWAGIMGVGDQKFPLIDSFNDRVHYAVRMGGMGVAMGSAIGALLVKQID